VTVPPYADHLPAVLRDGTEHTRLVFVRHGQQQPAPAGALPQEWLDGELTTTGLAQAAAVGDLLAGEPLAAIASSDLRRAWQTAEAIASRHKLEVQVFPGLSEIDCYSDVPAGVWPADHIGAEAWAAAYANFAREGRWELFGCGETGGQLRARVVAVVDGLVEKYPNETVAVVCHGGAINAYLAAKLGIAADMFFLPAHGAVTRVLASADGRRVIESVNDRHHLQAAGLLSY
jgi:broad specificity phosphatase PhoE